MKFMEATVNHLKRQVGVRKSATKTVHPQAGCWSRKNEQTKMSATDRITSVSRNGCEAIQQLVFMVCVCAGLWGVFLLMLGARGEHAD